jgi:hypothetical protein
VWGGVNPSSPVAFAKAPVRIRLCAGRDCNKAPKSCFAAA